MNKSRKKQMKTVKHRLRKNQICSTISVKPKDREVCVVSYT